MIPPVLENCTSVAAGPVRLVVETRQVTEEIVLAAHQMTEDELLAANFAGDYGASLHVYGTESGHEYLRFDCLERYPHYHYIKDDFDGMRSVTGEESREAGNFNFRYDQIALGEPLPWVLSCLRERMPEMLAFIGQEELAEEVRANQDVVLASVDEVEQMLLEAADVAEKAFAITGAKG